jgi:hypothetical protein
LKLQDKHWSQGVARLAVKYSGKLPFAEAAEVLQEIGQIDISVKSVWRLTERWGEALQAVEAQENERANRSYEHAPANPIEPQAQQRRGAAMDGTMIYIRGEGWKELKVGCLFDVELAPTIDPETQDWIEVGQARNTSYASHLGGPEDFGQKLWTEAQRRHWHRAEDTQVIGDGATWIWNLVADYFYDAHQVVDWYHAKEHLAQAAQLAYGEGSPEAIRWLKGQETPLFQGHADRVSQVIMDLAEKRPRVKEDLLKQAGYFAHNQHRMGYLEMRTEGWVIGSGMVESGGKRFKDRFTKSGMRWSRSGAERLLPIRTALMSGRFEERWATAYNSPPN